MENRIQPHFSQFDEWNQRFLDEILCPESTKRQALIASVNIILFRSIICINCSKVTIFVVKLCFKQSFLFSFYFSMISIYLFLFLLLIHDHDIFDQKILVKMDILIIFRVQYKKRIDITDRLRILTIIGGQMANICILAKLLYLLLPKWDGSHG